ncbi:MAG: DUF3857 domain-containing protein [Ferruginibacter sp.]|nr:DUF3857 domain-containing protein [Ferruginibacter sp.]
MSFRLIFAATLCLHACIGVAQEKSKIKFGKITADDFKQKFYSIDSNANAIVIADIGSTEIVGNDKGSFSLEFTKFRRVHIINKNGYDVANVVISLYTGNDGEEELKSLKAVTYTLENGEVVETKLDNKSSVFKDKINKNWVTKKFTFPNIKEGAIIEFQYKIHSDFIFNLQPWKFQGSYPCLWSEYKVGIPEFYRYITLAQGYQPFYIKDETNSRGNYAVSEVNGTQATQRSNFSAGVTDYRWVMKDVPALKEEKYTSTINNHLAQIEFQLAGYAAPFTPKNVMSSWPDACEGLLKDEDFGFQLFRDNGWLGDVVRDAEKGATTELEKARNIFTYVRDNMTCVNHNRIKLEKSLKSVLKTKIGNEAEINLLLTAMLTKAGLTADPVILSTKSHGYTYALYPLLDRFNYVITRLVIDKSNYYLDASHTRLGFNRLEYDAYNGHARVINRNATAIEFYSDSLREVKLCSVIIINDEKGNLTGRMNYAPGFYESYSLRDHIKEKGKDNFFSEIKKQLNADIDIFNPSIDSVDVFEEPLAIHYDFNINSEKEDIRYFNPMLGEGWKENPFKSAERSYPIEMPYTIDETYLLKLDVPEGYITDELPKQIRVKLNEFDDGFFEYLVSESNGVISLRSRICLKRAFYSPEEYDVLREFFNLVVKKHNEQIVFKKKK